MLELFWGILNLAILIYFIIICFKIIKIVYENLGRIATLIFVIGLMSFISKPNDDENKVKSFDLQNENKEVISNNFTGDISSKKIVLEENLTTKIEFYIQYGEKNGENKLLNAQTSRNGFVSGIDWKTKSIEIEKINNNSCKYNVIGLKDWKIFGIKIYTELKVFDGTFELKK